MLLLVYVLVNAPSVGWGNARTLGELAGALALVVLFVFDEQRHSNPLVPLSLFKIKGLGEADVTQILAMAGFYTMFFLVTLYMQEVLHYAAIRAGLCYLPVMVGAGVGAGVATKAIPKIGTRRLSPRVRCWALRECSGFPGYRCTASPICQISFREW